MYDQTGLKGVYDFTLRFSSDDTSTDLPDIFTALEEQLGLKLVPTRGPLEILVLVIDHAEKPGAN